MKRSTYFVTKVDKKGKSRIVLHRTVEEEYARKVYETTNPTKTFRIELRENPSDSFDSICLESKSKE